MNTKESSPGQKMIRVFRHMRSKTGRHELALKVLHQSWPVWGKLAWLYRRTVIRKVNIIVVIGSLGKTTTTRAVKTVLDLPVTDTPVSNQFGVLSFSLLKISPFAKHRVFEVAISVPGDMEKIGKIILPDVVVFTSVGLDHATQFSGIKHIAEEKARMLKCMKAGGVLFANGDDENIVGNICSFQGVTVKYGFGTGNDLICTGYQLKIPEGMQFVFSWKELDYTMNTKLLGEKMIYALLAAFGVASVLGIPAAVSLERLAGMVPARGRMQLKAMDNGIVLIGDFYKASVFSVYSAIDLLAKIKDRRILAVFGQIPDLTDPEAAYREIGLRFAGVVHSVFLVGDSEKATKKGTMEAGMDPERIISAGDSWKRVVLKLQEMMGENDLIYITGRTPQKFERIFLSLQGISVTCDRNWCKMYSYCEWCDRRNS